MKVDLSTTIYEMADKIATARMKQKSNYSSSNPMSNNYELVGVLGEFVYGYLTNEIPDIRLILQGDSGHDFRKGVQVKASEEYKAKHLIEYMDTDFSKFDVYVFVVVNIEAMTGYIKGWIYVDDFLNMATKRNFGYGERLAIKLSQLNPSWT